MKGLVVAHEIDDLSDYLTLIVEPTFAEYQVNRYSARHAFLTCVAIFHCIDRAAAPSSPGNLRKRWRKQSIEFLIVDMFAHRLKHVRNSDEIHVSSAPGIPPSYLVQAMEFHNLYFVIRDAITFVRSQVMITTKNHNA
jgi:hypothetical protein